MVSITSCLPSVTCITTISWRGVISSCTLLSEKRNTSRSISVSWASITPCSEPCRKISFNSSCVMGRSPEALMPSRPFTSRVETLSSHTRG